MNGGGIMFTRARTHARTQAHANAEQFVVTVRNCMLTAVKLTLAKLVHMKKDSFYIQYIKKLHTRIPFIHTKNVLQA
jgi:hypothetical protein